MGAADELRDRLRRDLHCCYDNAKETPIGAADRLDVFRRARVPVWSKKIKL
jgi:hypothetical protein